jgi:acetylornithine deacetylase/succinyl-diaminopimelate desuccinylase-like protein
MGKNRLSEVDWDAATAEAADILSEYIKINTCNPPGNETEGARFLQGILEKEGFSSQIIESMEGRGSLFCPWDGESEELPLMLLHHIDTVLFNEEEWDHPPLCGELIDGEIWGRGTIDCKSLGIAQLMAVLLLKRQGFCPRRGVVIAAVADEEAGGLNGAGWLIDNFPDFSKISGVVNEGGGFRVMQHEGNNVYPCQVGEKGILLLMCTFEGIPGHASIPRDDNCIVTMANFVHELTKKPFPFAVNEELNNFMESLEELGLENPRKLLYENEELESKELNHLRNMALTMSRSTFSPTVVNSGEKTNVIPSSAILFIDCRIAPGDDPESLVEKLEAMIPPHVSATVGQVYSFKPSSLPPEGKLYDSIVDSMKEVDPNAWIAPSIFFAISDNRFFIEKGIPAYGFFPIKHFDDLDEFTQRFHGINERIDLRDLKLSVQFFYNLLINYCSQ